VGAYSHTPLPIIADAGADIKSAPFYKWAAKIIRPDDRADFPADRSPLFMRCQEPLHDSRHKVPPSPAGRGLG
jgi:hypothetical protein